MGDFCSKCGKPLKNGRCEDCDKENTQTKEAVATNEIVSDYKNILKNILRKPVEVVKEYSKEEKFNLAIISIIISVAMFGFMIHTFVSNILKAKGLDLSSIVKYIDSIKSFLSGYGLDIDIDTNFGVNIAIKMLVAIIILIAVIYVLSAFIFKNSSKIKEITTIVGISNVLFILGCLISIIISFFNINIALICTIIFGWMTMVLIQQSIKEVLKLNSNQLIYSISIGSIAPIIVFASTIALVSVLNLVIVNGTSILNSLF